MTGAGGYDPIPDLITYMVWSRKGRTMRAIHAEKRIEEHLGITDDTGRDEKARLIRQAIEQAREARMPDRPVPCPRCEGCGQLADTGDREPWTAWTGLPVRSSAAVLLGVVRPVPCDECNGTGSVPGEDGASDQG